MPAHWDCGLRLRDFGQMVCSAHWSSMTRQEWRLAMEGLNYELVGDHFTEGRRKPF